VCSSQNRQQKMNNQFNDLDNPTNRLFNTMNKHYEPFNQCEESDSRMIVIGEITSIEVIMKTIYEFLRVNNNLDYKKQSRSSSYFSGQEEEDEDDFFTENGQSSISSQSDISIINVYRNFKLLKDRLNKNLNVLMDYSYLKPFCDLIKNKDISGRITAIAMGSLLKFLNYGLIDYTESQGSAQLLCETLTKVRFISTNAYNDEVVLMRILLLIKELLNRGFNLINNRTLNGMITTCFRMIFEPNLSELLRKNAEHTLIDIVRMLFMRLDEFQDYERIPEQVTKSTTTQQKEDKESTTMKSIEDGQISKQDKVVEVAKVTQKCYDLECIYDLFSYLAKIVNPNESANALTKSQVGLNVLIVVFETAVDSIGQKASLMKIVKNELCWSLVNIIGQSLQSNPSLQDKKLLPPFALSLRLSTIIFLHLRMQLKYQFQEMLIKLLEILSSLTPSQEYKDIAIEYLHIFFLQIPFLPHELFINYDCDPYAQNILEDLLDLLSKNCFLNSKLTNLQSTGNDSDLPVLTYVKKMSFNLLLLILKSLQKAELIKDFVLMPNQDSNSRKLRKLLDTNQSDELNDEQETTTKKRNFFLATSREQITFLKERKKLIWEASENFNAKPSKGVTFLQEKKLIESDQDLIDFLRENTRLDKKELGDYLSNRKNQEILIRFVKSFNFVGLRLDDALRLFLESFRLPGEAPLISFLLEQFANHWFESNNRQFANVDSAFALSYAIIMLNTDQHNSNVRQSMTCEDFIRNLRGVDGGNDFDQEMLKTIYHAIHENKIITPAEQLGVIREKYLWKSMLVKSESYYGIYYHVTKIKNEENKSSQLAFLNASIFEILWGPSISSLTFLFDKINMNKKTGLLKIILNQGFTSCAFLCARYGHLDDLIVSLCKFTINSAGGPMSPLLYPKSQEAALCLFNITKEYANEIRESWKNIIEIILNWFKGKFLDDMFEIEDFALNSKSIKLKRKINCKSNRKNIAENSSNIFTGFFQFFSGNDRSDYDQTDGSLSARSLDDESGSKNQLKLIYEQPLNILKDSKFFHFDSLVELIKAIIAVNVEFVDELGDDVEVFKLELLFQVIFLNRDRVALLWPQISTYLVKLLKSCETSEFLSERTISAIFRLAIRFICRPEKLSNQIFELMQKAMRTLSARQFQRGYTALALYTFITHSHCYLSTIDEWKLINEIILYVAINHKTEAFIPSNIDIVLSSTEDINVQSDQENLSSEFEKLSTVVQQRGYTSDSEIDLNKQQQQFNLQDQQQNLANPYQLMTGKSISLGRDSSFRIRDLNAYERCIEILNVIVKEIIPKYLQLNIEQAITDQNLTGIIESCIDTLRKFVEASIRIQSSSTFTSSSSIAKRTNSYKDNNRKRLESSRSSNQINSSHQHSLTLLTDSDTELDAIETDTDHPDYHHKLKERRLLQVKVANSTENCCIKLLELMHFLHINVNFINRNVQDEDDVAKEDEDKKTLTFDYLWTYIWCPLLQGIALLCCDIRKKVRLNAYTYLERQLLNPELKSLTAQQWENCFNKVLFPLLSKLLEQVNQTDLNDMDETRERVTSLLSKVYLQHLSSLYTLSTFTALWLTILEFMEKYMKAEMKTELVKEAIPQRLKNMLQVMINANCLNDELSSITWDRISHFLPNLKNEIIEPPQPMISPASSQTIAPTSVQNIPNSPNLQHNVQPQEHQQQQFSSPPTSDPSTTSYNYSPTEYPTITEFNQTVQQQAVDEKMFVANFYNNSDYMNQYCMTNNSYSLHADGSNNPSLNDQQQSQTKLTTEQQQYHSNYSNQQTNLNQEKSINQQQIILNYDNPSYGDQVMRQQPTYSNYSHYHQSSEHPIVYSNYNQVFQDTTLSTSPVYSNQQQLLGSPTVQQQNISPEVTVSGQQQLPQNYSTSKVIEMPVLQSSMNMNEALYQQIQQQKTFATSTYPVSSAQNKYPWPSPKLN